MTSFREILYATVAEWEIQQRMRTNNPSFDAWNHLSKLCGFKHASALRNMCLPKRENNQAKLGFKESIVIMSETRDYRLFHFMREELKAAKRTDSQLEIFAEPMRELEERI